MAAHDTNQGAVSDRRLRNRLAARRSRQRKMDQLADLAKQRNELEVTVRDLRGLLRDLYKVTTTLAGAVSCYHGVVAENKLTPQVESKKAQLILSGTAPGAPHIASSMMAFTSLQPSQERSHNAGALHSRMLEVERALASSEALPSKPTSSGSSGHNNGATLLPRHPSTATAAAGPQHAELYASELLAATRLATTQPAVPPTPIAHMAAPQLDPPSTASQQAPTQEVLSQLAVTAAPLAPFSVDGRFAQPATSAGALPPAVLSTGAAVHVPQQYIAPSHQTADVKLLAGVANGAGPLSHAQLGAPRAEHTLPPGQALVTSAGVQADMLAQLRTGGMQPSVVVSGAGATQAGAPGDGGLLLQLRDSLGQLVASIPLPDGAPAADTAAVSGQAILQTLQQSHAQPQPQAHVQHVSQLQAAPPTAPQAVHYSTDWLQAQQAGPAIGSAALTIQPGGQIIQTAGGHVSIPAAQALALGLVQPAAGELGGVPFQPQPHAAQPMS